MTRLDPTSYERRGLAAGCRHCGAAPGVWCQTVWTHRERTYAHCLHRMRIEDAAREGQLPIDMPREAMR